MLTLFGLLVNPHRARDMEALIRAISDACRRRGLHIMLTNELGDVAANIGAITVANAQEMTERADALIVAGGDGTILHAAAMAARGGVPVLGLHAGNKGFLSEVTQDGLEEALDAIAAGSYTIESRITLCARLIEPANAKSPSDTEPLENALALNDAVITRGSYARMIRIRAWVGDTLIGGYDGDGLIIASPTGSTGYALSTGGPIISPEVPCILISPICPHASQSRQIVLPDDAVVRLDATCPTEGGGMLLTLDGRAPIILGRQARIEVAKSAYPLLFIRIKQFPFFERLRSKLAQWNI
ncbi:MAG: NAD(+)/NADH kinase [Oscillospiraceae bacterium]|jgi:NAD+ kinase|nr:NAD(+)/NADH kinase [Oscillospiraceae bacterium]